MTRTAAALALQKEIIRNDQDAREHRSRHPRAGRITPAANQAHAAPRSVEANTGR